MTPLSSIATIDDLIVALLRLGYKKRYDEWDWSRDGGIIEDYDKERKGILFVFGKYLAKVWLGFLFTTKLILLMMFMT